MSDIDKPVSRRRFVAMLSVATGSIGSIKAASSVAADVLLRETADLITGPFYPQLKPRDTDVDLTMIKGHQQRAEGQVVQLSGRLLNVHGKPLPNVRIEIWQANTHGRYTHPSDPSTHLPLDPNFEGYAELYTDRDGRYAITTVKPGPYPTARGDMRAPHIHFEVHGKTDRKVSQLFFPGEALNDADRHLNSVRRTETLLANVISRKDSVISATWDIVLTTG